MLQLILTKDLSNLVEMIWKVLLMLHFIAYLECCHGRIKIKVRQKLINIKGLKRLKLKLQLNNYAKAVHKNLLFIYRL